MAWVAAAIATGTTIIGAVNANQNKQREKGFIDTNYNLQRDELNTRQAATAEDTAESLNQRGMSPIASAMGVGPSTVGGQTIANEDKQFGLEQTDLSNQRTQAQKENSANYTNALIGDVVNGVSTAGKVYGAEQDNNAGRTSPIANAMRPSATMSGGPATPGAFGIDAIDPLGHPSSAWNQNNRTLNGVGLSNSDFNTGNG